MATTIAEYFTEELTDWRRTITFYSSEVDNLTVRLDDVIRRNSIPDIATKVENQQNKLNNVVSIFSRLLLIIQRQETALKTDNHFVDDTSIMAETEQQQKDLRQQIAQAEKEYMDTKNDCYKFLSELFKNS